MNALPSELAFVVRRELIRVQVIISNDKALRLSAKAGEGLVVSVPLGVSETSVRAFISPHLPRLSRYLTSLARQVYFSLEEHFLFLWGKRLRLEVLTGFSKPGLTIKGATAYLRCSAPSLAALQEAIDEHALMALSNELSKQLLVYEKKLGRKAHAFVIRNYKNKWACNYLTQGRLGFHAYLIHFPKATLTYLIVHELAHDLYPQHDKAFWAYVAQNNPDYATHEALLAFRQSFQTD